MGCYDDQKYIAKRLMTLAASGGISIAGTVGTATELYRLRIPEALKFTAVDIVTMVGGSTAGPTLTFNKSAAGTGALAAFGTCAFTTHATNAAIEVDVTATEFADGDHLVLRNEVGTADYTPQVTINLTYIEAFPASA